MDEFEKKLRRDAQALPAEVPPDLRRRIDASLQGIEPIKTLPGKRITATTLWWASSLTGLAAALLLVVVVNVNGPNAGNPQDNVVDVSTEPPAPVDLPLIVPSLDIRSADFTSPLEDELQKLQADIEKARRNVREDVDFTF